MISRGNEVCHIDSSVVVMMAMSVLVPVTVDAAAAVVDDDDDPIVDPTVVVDDNGDDVMMFVLGSGSWSWSGKKASSSSVFPSSNRVCSDLSIDGRPINDDMDGDDTVELLLITVVE